MTQASRSIWSSAVSPEAEHATVRDLAKAETIDEVYLGRVLRITLLAPKIVEAILAGTQPAHLELHDLL